jgi:lipopolysaccharide export LptBFGC system permease protein LptF
MLLRFFYSYSPEFVSYIIPMSALVSTLVTIGVMTKNSELIVMRACGMSLYRAVAPLVLFSVLAGAGLFLMQEWILEAANHRAERLEGAIRGWPSQEPSAVNRWIASENGDIYHYDVFDPAVDAFARFSRYHIDRQRWRLGEMMFADSIANPLPVASPSDACWTAAKRLDANADAREDTDRTAVVFTRLPRPR